MLDSLRVGRTQVRVSFWLLFFSSLAITGLGALRWNHSIQVPLVRWLNDPSLYPNDPFMSVLARYPSGLWPLVALLARLFPLEGTLLVLFVMTRLFVLYAAGRLARAFAPHSGLAVVGATALFALPIDAMLGYGTIVETYFEQTSLAIPCVLMAAAAFYERRRFAWVVWLAAVFNLTSLYGTFALVYFGALFIFDPECRGAWREWLRPFLLFPALASYGLYLSLSAARAPAPDEASWFVAARLRGWSHFYPLTWGWVHYAQFGAFLLLLAVCLALGRRASPRRFRQGLIGSGVACAWLIDAFVAPYVLQSRRLMMMQPARATDLLACCGAIAMISAAASRIDRGPAAGGGRGWLLALGASFLVWLVPGSWVVVGLLALAVLPPVWRGLEPWIAPRRLAWLLVAWVALAGAAAGRERWSHSRALVFRGPDPVTRQLASWAEANTPADAVFLLNTVERPNFDQFMGLSGRSIFTSPEQGTALYWAPDFVPEWLERLRALRVELEYRGHASLDHAFDDALSFLRDADIARLKQRNRLNYWVVPDDFPSNFRVAWSTGRYKVLEVP